MKDIHYDLMFNTVWDIFRNNYKCLIDIHLMQYVYLMIINIDEKKNTPGPNSFALFLFVIFVFVLLRFMVSNSLQLLLILICLNNESPPC